MATARRKYRTVAISFGREPLVRVLATHAIIASKLENILLVVLRRFSLEG